MSPSTFTLQWFPGHMAKAKRDLESRIKQVDFVIEVADARAPLSTRNPELRELIGRRPSLLVLAKADLAEPQATRTWMEYLQNSEKWLASASLLDSREIRRVRSALAQLTKQGGGRSSTSIADRPRIPGIAMPRIEAPPVRGMVVGMPNTGKSSLIRALGGGRVATGNRPGVTRGIQQVSLGGNVTLFDTPGILWPRASSGEIALHLAWLGYVGERAYDISVAAKHLITWLASHHPDQLVKRYGLEDKAAGSMDPHDALVGIATRYGKLTNLQEKVKAGATILLHDFRRGKLGPITLEDPTPRKENQIEDV